MRALATSIGSTAQVTVRSDEREMGRSTYLTHRLMRLKSCRCLAAQPAQRHYCSTFGRRSQYTRSWILN